jgi:alcohol dehydrogenase YqhD (iron-dependent ADH family)
MKVLKERAGNRILQLGKELFGTSDVDQTIEAMESFFKLLGSPLKCQEAGIEASRKEEILSLMNRDRAEGLNFKLSDKEREELLEYMF